MSRTKLGLHFGNNLGYNSSPTQVPRDINMVLLDNHYRVVDYYWFRKFNNWFAEMKHNNGLNAGQGARENMDCDNYSMLYKSMMSAAAYKSGAVSEPAVAMVVTKQLKEFSSIPATGGLHMLIFVMTSQGWFIVEPQTGDFVELHKYPNQQGMNLIIF